MLWFRKKDRLVEMPIPRRDFFRAMGVAVSGIVVPKLIGPIYPARKLPGHGVLGISGSTWARWRIEPTWGIDSGKFAAALREQWSEPLIANMEGLSEFAIFNQTKIRIVNRGQVGDAGRRRKKVRLFKEPLPLEMTGDVMRAVTPREGAFIQVVRDRLCPPQRMFGPVAADDYQFGP